MPPLKEHTLELPVEAAHYDEGLLVGTNVILDSNGKDICHVLSVGDGNFIIDAINNHARLTEENKKLTEELKWAKRTIEENKILASYCVRLRAALEKIANLCSDSCNSDCYRDGRDIAKEALFGKPREG